MRQLINFLSIDRMAGTVLGIAYLMLILLVCILASPALAQTADTTINLGPTIGFLVSLVVAVGVAVLSFLLGQVLLRIKNKTGIEIDNQYAEMLARYAENKAGEILAKIVNTDKFQIDVRNEIIAKAGEDALARIPETLAHYGVTPANAAAWVAKFIVAKLGWATATQPDQPTTDADGLVFSPPPVPAVPA